MKRPAVSEILISTLPSINVEELPFELVERKGVGHPDTICDAIAERASQYYSRYCMEQFGRIAHHWFDKVMLIGGEAEIDYGFGQLLAPYKVIFAGKGARQYGEKAIPVEEILFAAASDVLKEVLTSFDPTKYLMISNEIVDFRGPSRKSSRYRPQQIEDLFDIMNVNRVSNDCNLLSGYAPLSRLENMVLACERFVNGSEFKKVNGDTGWDVKVFGSRRFEKFKLVVNMPFIAKLVPSADAYEMRKYEVLSQIQEYIETECQKDVEITLNPDNDRSGKPYLTVFGSVADTGDVGVVGRGNRINGLITPMRSMSIEAPAGKNPIDHTGKIYGVLVQRLSEELFRKIGKSVSVNIFTTKSAPIDRPNEILLQIHGSQDNDFNKDDVQKVVESYLAPEFLQKLTQEFVFNGVTLW